MLGRRGILGNKGHMLSPMVLDHHHLGGIAGGGPYIHIIFTSPRGGLGVNPLLRNTLGVLRAIGHLFGPEVVM